MRSGRDIPTNAPLLQVLDRLDTVFTVVRSEVQLAQLDVSRMRSASADCLDEDTLIIRSCGLLLI